MTNKIYSYFPSFLSLMSFKSFTLFLFLFSQSTYGATRIAIVSDPKTTVEDLIVASLSAVKDIELLERSEIDKVFDEQKISASSINETQILSLGKILKTDLFAVIQSDEKNIPIGLIVFDAESGVRYWDSALPETDMDKIAKFAADSIKTAVEKRKKSSEGKLKYLSLLSVRNADLPRGKDPFCNAVGILLMRQLRNSPDIAVLERSYLEHLNKERNLPGMEFQNKLLASTLLLQLEIGRCTDGKGPKATLFLPDNQSVSAESADYNPANFANPIASKFADVLKVNVKTETLDRKKEAARFYNEAVFFHNHKEWENALSKIECAFALDSDNGKYQTLLSFYLMDVALFLIDPSTAGTNTDFQYKREISVNSDTFARSLELVDRSLDYKLNLLEKTRRIENPIERQKVIDDILGWRSAKQYFQTATAVTSGHNEKTKSLLNDCQMKINACLISFDYENRIASVKNIQTFANYENWISANLQDIRLFSANSEICIGTMEVLCYKWLNLFKKYEKYGGESNPSSMIIGAFVSILKYSHLQLTSSDLKIIGRFFKIMQSHPFPDVQAYGEYGLLWLELLDNNLSGDEIIEKVQSFQDSIQDKIASLPKYCHKMRRKYTYAAIIDALRDLLGDGNYFKARRKMEVELFRFMESQKDFSAYVASIAIMESSIYKENQAEALKLIDDSYSLIASPDTNILDANLKYFYENIDSLRSGIYSKNPDLIPSNVKVPWSEQKLLFRAGEKNEIEKIVCPVLSGGKLYFAGLGTENNKSLFIQLVALDLNSGTCNFSPKSILDLDIKNSHTLNGIRYYNEWEGNAACFSDGEYYLATKGMGIYIFSVNGDQVRINGLPSNNIQSIAVLKNKIYAGLGEPEKEGFLIAYDLNKNNFELLASSRRIEKISPFDDLSPPVQFQSLTADPGRNQIIFACLSHSHDPVEGLWAIDINNNKMRQLTQFDFPSVWASPINDDTIIFSSSFEIFSYDISKGEADLLNSYASPLAQNKKNFKTSRSCSYRAIAPHILLDGWLWSADYFGRISPDGKSQEVFYFHNGTELFLPREFIQVAEIGNKKYVIAVDQRQIWIFKMDNH